VKAAGTTIVTIWLAVNQAAADTLRQMATRPDLYFEAPSGDDLEQVLREIAGQVSEGRVTGITVTDLLPLEVEYVSGSATPTPDSYEARTLTWTVGVLQTSGWTARYAIRPLTAGTYAANKAATLLYTDADGSAGSATFPQPILTVREPEPILAYLPLAMLRQCQPAQPFDVVLALDTSSSMWGDKLARTRDAAREFLMFLELPPSRASVVAFNAEANLVVGLTANRRELLDALDQLPLDSGSRIDLAVEVAAEELTGVRRAPEHTAVLILLTDGRQAGAPRDSAVAAARDAREAGITIYTIGIGSDVDPGLLTEIAGAEARYYFAPSSDDLARIYRDIAGTLPCIRPE
jgi:hypothetical protein